MGFSGAASPSTSHLAVLSVQTQPQTRKGPQECVLVKKEQVAQIWSAQFQHSSGEAPVVIKETFQLALENGERSSVANMQ